MANSKRSIRIIQTIFAGSLLLPLLGASILLRAGQQGWSYLDYGLVGLAVVGCLLIQYLAQQGKNIDWFLSLAILNLMLATPELLLRRLDFHYETGIQFGYPKLTHFESFVPDEELFWRLRPNRPGVNSLGFPGKEIEHPKPPGLYRLLFLGDSVPQQGYPEIVERRLNDQDQLATQFESASLALSGYSTHQGRVLVDKYGDLFEPDLVLVSYGWNDHWQAYGAIDSKKTITVDQSLAGRFSRELYHQSRLLQGLRYLLVPWLGADQPLPDLRVPAAEYRQNLSYIGHFFAQREIPVIFITPPTAHHRLGVPDYLVNEGFAVDKEAVLRYHRAYNQIVRDIAAANGWPLLDLEQAWAAHPNLSDTFIEDGIHLTPAGLNLAAEDIVEDIVSNWQVFSHKW